MRLGFAHGCDGSDTLLWLVAEKVGSTRLHLGRQNSHILRIEIRNVQDEPSCHVGAAVVWKFLDREEIWGETDLLGYQESLN